MANSIKDQQDILDKLNIKTLHPMQKEAIAVIASTTNTILLSPTGTGKTLAFLLPLLDVLDPTNLDVQVLIIVPSRELAIQIEQVAREMGSGFKVNAVYGGRPMSKDKIEIKHVPAILIGTPGRILDHFEADRFSKTSIKTLILDEFDKSLEDGFEEEMKAIIGQLPSINKRILTSATQLEKIPGFVRLNKPTTVDYLTVKRKSTLAIKTVVSQKPNKLPALLELLQHIGNHQGIVFCNLRESIDRVSHFLTRNKINHSCFSGGMEQQDRERSLITFRNGTSQILLATDLASRGLDIPELNFIIHYELPKHKEEFIHRNGRTARVNAKGTAYVLKGSDEQLPDFIKASKDINISKKAPVTESFWETLFVSGGRKDKISKGDIVGLFMKQGGLTQEQLGNIELKQDCAFVAVPLAESQRLVKILNNTRLKKKKVRIKILE
ncbi:superfamily II DNA/RNA helicase [Gelidibacter algens]|uniref:Superfamily II DNA/RNA helicase n=1 Tax=Gelidibacter algens TaxID=49280 RepID=A0A1A7R2H5_9FLAO|nr:DEAD/DEAH box helicase [Gelidibacter algens]OBX26465.1 helicase [Gelidibacter algens]RAJ26721.1 superfamily II DNA/RNA helicase [Gelidibacter algens]